MVFDSKHLPEEADTVAPDGSWVRVLLAVPRGGLAHFQLDPGQTSIAVRHRTVDEVWYFLSGRGVMWRRDNHRDEEAAVGPGDAITIPVGTVFQFRSTSPDEPLTAIGATMPPWPGDGEAIRCEGRWSPTVRPGPGLAEA